MGAAFLLKRCLESRGCQVMLTSVRDFERVVRHWKPHAIITNTKSTVIPSKRLAPQAMCFYWPGEGGGEEYQYSCALKMKPEIFNACDYLLLWGKTPQTFFTDIYPEAVDKTIICGSPRLDTLKLCRDIIHNPEKKNSVGIVGKYELINHHEGFATTTKLAKTERLYKGVIRQVVSFYHIIKAIHVVLETTDLKVSIRPYPSEDLNSYHKIIQKMQCGDRVEVDGTYLFGDWAARQDFIISETSTSFLECYLLGIPAVSIDKIIAKESQGMAHDWGTDISHESCYLPESFEDLSALIQTELTPPPHSNDVETYLDEYHDWNSPFSANDRTAEVVVQKLNERSFGAKIHVPKKVLQFVDDLSVRRAMFRNPLHANFNYCPSLHKEPAYFDQVISRIANTTSRGDVPQGGGA
ncbi:MAG: hypothetical protein HON92_03640 [Planctomycetaceae bacterium]|nr:hypothetical protein [Planctomycetaceae bacterium]